MNIQILLEKFVESTVRAGRGGGGVVLTGNREPLSAQTSGGHLSLPPHASEAFRATEARETQTRACSHLLHSVSDGFSSPNAQQRIKEVSCSLLNLNLEYFPLI